MKTPRRITHKRLSAGDADPPNERPVLDIALVEARRPLGHAARAGDVGLADGAVRRSSAASATVKLKPAAGSAPRPRAQSAGETATTGRNRDEARRCRVSDDRPRR